MQPKAPLNRLAALTAVLLVFALGLMFIRDRPKVEYYTTQIGEQRSLPQKDGSVITLNTDSGVEIRRDHSTLHVKISRGEVNFNMIPHRGSRLVVLVAEHIEIRDTATIFAVRVVDHGARVTVKEGQVEISFPDLTQVPLHENQQATIDIGPALLTIRSMKISPLEIDRQLAWIRGSLDFQCETIGNAAKEFNRYNRTHIEVTDESTKRVRIGGVFSTTHPVTFTDAVAQLIPTIALDVAYDQNGARILRLHGALQSDAIPNCKPANTTGAIPDSGH